MSRIYLDHAATTPLRPEVLEAMRAVEVLRLGNPSSAHAEGREARRILEGARANVAAALEVPPASVRFVRGGTESDNLAIRGTLEAARARGTRPSVVHSAIDHPAVVQTAEWEEAHGADRTVLPVDREGRLDLGALEQALTERPTLVSLLWVNNEVGSVVPMAEVARRCRDRGALLHADAVQAIGKIPVDLGEARVDLLSVTGHKIQGPRSAGLLVVRAGVQLEPPLRGGGQEGGVRPGTEDVVGAVGMAEAVRLAVAEQPESARRWSVLRDRLETGLVAAIPGARVHGGGGHRAPHLSNVGFPDDSGTALVSWFDRHGIAVSAGSACHSGSGDVGSVLRAMLGDEAGRAAPVRFSMGKDTMEAEIDRVIEVAAASPSRERRPVPTVEAS